MIKRMFLLNKTEKDKKGRTLSKGICIVSERVYKKYGEKLLKKLSGSENTEVVTFEELLEKESK